jgi:rusticyanin
MTNQYVWIGIVVGVFVAGIGIGYVVFINTYNPYTIMMQDPQLRQQMYSYMFQNRDFMYGMMGNPNFQNQYMGPWMMQNQQFQQQYAVPYSGNPPANYTSPHVQLGPSMMYGQYGNTFKTISIKNAEMTSQLPTYAQISKTGNTITFNSQNVDMVPLSFGGDEAKNMTGATPPSYAKDDVFVIGNMIDPTLVLKAGTALNITSINLDVDMAHSFVIMRTGPPYSYMPMHNMMSGGIVAFMPVLPNADEKDGYAYELSYQITLSQPGTYWYVCTYPGHAEDGMYGKIIVS